MMHNQFPQAANLIYLNHAAVGPWPQCTADAVKKFADENAQYGAKYYPQWLVVEKELRQHLANLIAAPSSAIALLKNTSEALSVIAYGLDWRQGDNVVLAAEEFPSNRIVWESLQQRFGVEVRIVDFSDWNDPEASLLAAVDRNTRLLTTSSVHYASGLRMNLQRLGEACHRRGTLFCVDAIQSLGAFELQVDEIHADFVVADGHKWMLGPEGLALFYCRPERLEQLKLQQYGWHMVADAGNYDRQDWQIATDAQRFECGSPNMLGIHALHASLAHLLQTGIAEVSNLISRNISYLIELIKEIKGASLLTPTAEQRRAGILTFTIEGCDHQALHQYLQANSVICAARGGGIRWSPHCYNTLAQLEQAYDVLKTGLGQVENE